MLLKLRGKQPSYACAHSDDQHCHDSRNDSMATGNGEGGGQVAPLARAVIGGLFASTITALFILPLVFAWVKKELLHSQYHLTQKTEKVNTMYSP